MPALIHNHTPNSGVKNPASAMNLLNRLHRYRRVFLKRWWVFVLCICTALAVQGYLISIRPPSWQSTAKLIITGNVAITATSGSGPRDQPTEFVGTQIELIRSATVLKRAIDKLQALHPEMRPSPVSLDVSKAPAALILVCTALGQDAIYTQRYLRAVTEEYIAYRQDLRSNRADGAITKLADEVANLDRRIRATDEAIVEFQKKHNVLAAEHEGPNLAKEVVRRKTELAALKSEYDVIQLLSPEQQLERLEALERRANSDKPEIRPVDTINSRTDYQSTQQQIALLKAEREDLGRFLKPKHPKIIFLNDELTKNERIIGNLREQALEQLNSRRESLRRQIEKLEVDAKDAETKALEIQSVMSEFSRLRENKDRDVQLYRQYSSSLNDVNLNTKADPDIVALIEPATVSIPISQGLARALAIAVLIGLLVGLTILVILDQMDDRINSLGEFQSVFHEPILGQIPGDHSGKIDEFLKADDTRPMMAESFRNIRSSLLYMPLDGARPKTLLVTSAVPNEGKSTIATNLALVLSFAGIKTLLVDADLRRGRIASAFDLTNEPGFADVLGGSIPWRDAVRKTGIENFFILPRGRIIQQPSEYLLSSRTDQFLRDVYPEFEYIIFDTAPVLAADDTASLAPKMDAVLFVVRLSHTSAKMGRNALDILYKRQANVPGLILNAVDTSSPEFVYYRYPEYYYQVPAKDEKKEAAAVGKA